MYYSYIEIEYVATNFSPTRTDLALTLLTPPLGYLAALRTSWAERLCSVANLILPPNPVPLNHMW
jgi:hypothetical protein